MAFLRRNFVSLILPCCLITITTIGLWVLWPRHSPENPKQKTAEQQANPAPAAAPIIHTVSSPLSAPDSPAAVKLLEPDDVLEAYSTVSDLNDDHDLVEKAYTKQMNQRLFRKYPLQVGTEKRTGKALSIIITCSDVCPDYAEFMLLYDDDLTREQCDAIAGYWRIDPAWGGDIGCAPYNGFLREQIEMTDKEIVRFEAALSHLPPDQATRQCSYDRATPLLLGHEDIQQNKVQVHLTCTSDNTSYIYYDINRETDCKEYAGVWLTSSDGVHYCRPGYFQTLARPLTMDEIDAIIAEMNRVNAETTVVYPSCLGEDRHAFLNCFFSSSAARPCVADGWYNENRAACEKETAIQCTMDEISTTSEERKQCFTTAYERAYFYEGNSPSYDRFYFLDQYREPHVEGTDPRNGELIATYFNCQLGYIGGNCIEFLAYERTLRTETTDDSMCRSMGGKPLWSWDVYPNAGQDEQQQYSSYFQNQIIACLVLPTEP